jgi:N-methylhydantoinase A
VPIPNGKLEASHGGTIAERFDQVYRQLYQRSGPSVGLEVVNWRLVVSGTRPDLKLARGHGDGPGSAESALKGDRRAYVPEAHEYQDVAVYDRYRQSPGARFAGPANVEERESTVIVGQRGRVLVDELRNLRIELEDRP